MIKMIGASKNNAAGTKNPESNERAEMSSVVFTMTMRPEVARVIIKVCAATGFGGGIFPERPAILAPRKIIPRK
jgi:hypothetical protein